MVCQSSRSGAQSCAQWGVHGSGMALACGAVGARGFWRAEQSNRVSESRLQSAGPRRMELSCDPRSHSKRPQKRSSTSSSLKQRSHQRFHACDRHASWAAFRRCPALALLVYASRQGPVSATLRFAGSQRPSARMAFMHVIVIHLGSHDGFPSRELVLPQR